MSDPNTSGVAARETARPAAGGGGFDREADVVVVGGGGAGLPAALFARWLGDDVLLLEKARELGGTAKKAAFWYWVPNNEPMRAAGLTDDKDDFLRYVARLSRPTRYDPTSPTLGLTEWEYAMAAAIHDCASTAAELLAERGALPYRHCPAVPDYWAELPEDKAPYGRVLVPLDASESMSDGGENAIRTMSAAAERDGVEIRTSHRVQRLVVRGRARGRGRGDHSGRADAPDRRPQGGGLRDRRLHPRRRVAHQLPRRSGVPRLRGRHERG
jgi:3-oxosteroid 1-dehydrogenase